jgi:hypothetical protein
LLLSFQAVPEEDWFCPNCRCAVCGGPPVNANPDEFNEMTVLSCDQCERECMFQKLEKDCVFFLLGPILCFQFLCQRISLFTQSNNDPWQLQWSWGWTKPKAWIIAITVDNCETNVSLWFLICECWILCFWFSPFEVLVC